MKNFIDPIKTLGIIGLSKNTGKTTTLNAIINLYEDIKIGLTSIGLDGEDLDQITYLPKPKIYVKQGMIVATACGCLEVSDVNFRIIEKTELQTPLGPINIIEVLSSGNMVVAGPTTNKELSTLIEHMKQYVDKIFVDGAFNRMTFANIKNIDAIVLATGASVGPLMEKTIEKTKIIVDSFGLSKSELYQKIPSQSMIVRTNQKQYQFQDKQIETLKELIQDLDEIIESIYIKGAITPKYIHFFINKTIKNFTLICDDATKLLISEHDFSILKKLKIELNIIQPCPLLFVTVNPASPIGYHYDANIFLSEMKNAIDIPVYNVMKME